MNEDRQALAQIVSQVAACGFKHEARLCRANPHGLGPKYWRFLLRGDQPTAQARRPEPRIRLARLQSG